MKKKNKKNLKRISVLALAGVMLVGTIFAYFISKDEVVNTFVVGDIDIKLTEPSWDALPDENHNDIPDEAENMLPGEEIAKDPTVSNVGTNDAFVFVDVEVPYADVVLSNEDGSLANGGNPVGTELFTYNINSGWVEVGSLNIENGVAKHTYAYVGDGNSNEMKALVKGDSTSAVFNSVKFALVVDGQGLELSEQSIKVTAKGIQTTYVNGGVTSPNEVYEVLNNQISN